MAPKIVSATKRRGDSKTRALSRLWHSSVVWSMGPIFMRVAGFALAMSYALRTIPREQIGLWYGMVSLTVLAGCVELGLSTTIGRFATYYLAGARIVPSMGLHDDSGRGSPNYAALHGLIAEARRVYRIMAVIFLVGCLSASMIWMAMLPGGHSLDGRARTALAVLVVGSTLNMIAQYWPNLLYGLGEVRTYGIYQTVGQVAGYLLAITGLWLGAGLVALAAGQIIQGVIWRVLAQRKVTSILSSHHVGVAESVEWRTLWPMTWRSGVGMAASQLVLPVLPLMVTRYSLSEAASFGFSLQVALLLHLFSSTWIAAAWPRLSSQRVRGDISFLRRTAARRIAMSVATFIVIASAIPFIASTVLAVIHSRTPFLSSAMWTLLAIATLSDMVVAVHMVLLQTGNRTPYLGVIAATGALNVASAVVLGPRFGTLGILTGCIATQLLLATWWIPRRAWRDLRAPRLA